MCCMKLGGHYLITCQPPAQADALAAAAADALAADALGAAAADDSAGA